MDTNEAALLYGLGIAVISGIVSWAVSHKVNTATATSLITDSAVKLIKPLEDRVNKLEQAAIEDKKMIAALWLWIDDLRSYIDALYCQVRGLGAEPVKFEPRSPLPIHLSPTDQFGERNDRS
jgi:hypothetical protein